MDYEQIWAPWRLSYIRGEAGKPGPMAEAEVQPGEAPACFLCQDVAEGDDRQRLVVQRSEKSITILNRYPYNNGHLLVAPQRHVARLDQLDGSEQLDLTRLVAQAVSLLEDVLTPHGFNIGLNLGRAAGAGLPGHLHWHVVPRWSGDTNFMPVFAGVRVIPQSLEALWEALRGAMKD